MKCFCQGKMRAEYAGGQRKKASLQKPLVFGSEGEIRTLDTRIMIPLL